MASEINVPLLVDEVGNDLVAAFGKASRLGTTPDSIGQAKEKAVLERLGSLFPPAVRVGRGHVIDAGGGVSGQMDVVISEAQFCPEFRINDDPSCAYYPCQGVIAVGEVKSTLNRKELRDIWKKAESVRKLRRYAQGESAGGMEERALFRPYGSSMVAPGAARPHDQDGRGMDQIMVFGLAGRLGPKVGGIREETAQLLSSHGSKNAPNAVGVMDSGDLFVPTTKREPSGQVSACASYMEATHSTHIGPNAAVFRWIVMQIWQRYSFGFTAPVYEMAEYFDTPAGWEDLFDSGSGNDRC